MTGRAHFPRPNAGIAVELSFRRCRRLPGLTLAYAGATEPIIKLHCVTFWDVGLREGEGMHWQERGR